MVATRATDFDTCKVTHRLSILYTATALNSSSSGRLLSTMNQVLFEDSAS